MSAAAEKAYEAIYQSIRQGVIPPGTRLIERQLCQELAISRTPVREALRRLTAEGLVENRPNRGVIVSQLSEAELAKYMKWALSWNPLLRGWPHAIPVARLSSC